MTPDTPHGAALPALLFRIADRRCALALAELGEVIHLPALVRIAGLPAPVVGFFSLAGDPIPVADGGRVLGVPGVAEGLYTPLLVLRCRQTALALMVDEVEGVAATRVGAALEESDSLNGCVRAIVETPGGPAQLLDADRILLAAERERLASLEELTRERLAALGEGTDGG